MLKRTFFAILALAATGVVMAQAYRWVDENGIVHYSDRPVEGAEEVLLQQTERRTRPTPSRRVPSSQESVVEEPAAVAFSYESLTFSSPGPEETLWNIEGVLNVTLDLQPGLQPGHQVRVYFDGTPTMVNSASFQLNEVYRGVHNLQAEVLDESGALMIRSLPNRFYVQQNAIGR